jgi:hypothetical protein
MKDLTRRDSVETRARRFACLPASALGQLAARKPARRQQGADVSTLKPEEGCLAARAAAGKFVAGDEKLWAGKHRESTPQQTGIKVKVEKSELGGFAPEG